MSAHIALPAVTGRKDVPATLSRAVMTDLLRGELGFEGVSITVPSTWPAWPRAGRHPRCGRGDRGGVDLLLTAADTQRAADREGAGICGGEGVVPQGWLGRVGNATRRTPGVAGVLRPPPDIDVVGSAEHPALAEEQRRGRSRWSAIRAVCCPGQVRGRARPRGDAEADGPDPGRHLVDGRARACGGPASVPWRRGPGGRRARTRRGGDRRGPLAGRGVDLAVVGTIDGHRLRSQLKLVEAVVATDADDRRGDARALGRVIVWA